MHLKYAKMLAIVVHENMKPGHNTLNNERLTYFTALQYINNLETKTSYKRKVNFKNLKFFKKSIERFKNYSLIC